MRVRKFLCVAALPAALLAAACGDDGGGSSAATTDEPSPGTDEPTTPDGVFESAHPAGVTASGESLAAGGVTPGAVQGPAGSGVAVAADGNVAAPTSPAPEPAPGVPNGGEAESSDEGGATAAARAIEEADIIKLEGNRLYALSSHGGVSVIDVSNPDALKLLGRHRSTATPFELYVRDETMFVLYNGYGEYEYLEDEGYYNFYQTSYVIALDASDPQNIVEQERFEIPGYISDSRLIGDVVYVVAFDDSYCYRCGDTPETNVMSLDVTDPSDITKVDELTFAERQDEYSWRRSLSATDERLYIAGPRYGNGAEPEGSIIQVVDIADGGGDMQKGDALEVAGQINSRWQMDEYDGILRVISQPLWWREATAPLVETFEIESSEQLNELGSVALELPRPEQLQTVRFDGTRGYAITFEQTDPLFTIDLSDPANPVQAGELEMPGWVYYMEPRGDRVIGLGYDQGNADGGLTVSIFDVTELAEPTMLDRVNFGGQWASLAEDQDRIHKSFQVLDERELVLVPFAGWSWDETNNECGGYETYLSGVQLIDWVDDTLKLRGIAPSTGQARRAFFVEDRLLTMSDERLEAFDIEDRDDPESTSQVDLAQIVQQVAVLGDAIVHIGNSWWGQTLEVSVSSLDDLLSYQTAATLEVDDLNHYDCESESWFQGMLSGGDNVYLTYSRYDYSQNSDYKEETRVRTIDVSDPKNPKVAGDAALGGFPNYGRNYIPGMVDNGEMALGVGDALAFAEHRIEYNNLGFVTRNDFVLNILDFSDADDPKSTEIELPESLGSTGLLASGDVVATSHFETSPTNPQAVRFFLDRVDISDPSDPKSLDAVNIPGSLLAYDHDSERALTVDYQYVTVKDISPKQCYEEEFGQFNTPDPSLVDYEDARGSCTALRYKLLLVQIDGDEASVQGSYDVDKGVQITSAALGDDRVFLGTGATAVYYGGGVATPLPPSVGVAVSEPGFGSSIGYYSYPVYTGEAKLLVASGVANGELEVAAAELETTDSFYGFNQLVAKGTTAVVATGWQGRLSVVDASKADSPVVRDSVEVAGYVQDLDIVGDVAIAALGSAGVQMIQLGD